LRILPDNDWQSLLDDSNPILIVDEADKIENLDQQQRSRPSQSGTENNVLIVNIQLNISGMDFANETLKKSSEFFENVTKFNLNVMKTLWNPFLPYTFYPRLNDKTRKS
jgi:hypothetical protein